MSVRRWSFPDILASLVMAGIVLAILLQRLAHDQSAARAVVCSNHLKQLGLALHNYHSAYDCLPQGSGGTDSGSQEKPLAGNASRLSVWVALLPFFEEQALWEQIANPWQGDILYPAMGPVPWHDSAAYQPWARRPTILVCPNDKDAKKFSTAASYVVNYGDAVYDVGAPWERAFAPYSDDITAKRGVFVREHAFRFRDILDGLSYTVMFSEAKIAGPQVAKEVAGLAVEPARCAAVREIADTMYWPEGRGARWAEGSLLSTGFQMILPPNSSSATSLKGELEGVLSASSYHADGVHIALADGRVAFVLDTIDSGNSQSPSVGPQSASDGKLTASGSKSPYGLWGGLGTRASRETLNLVDANITEPPLELSDKMVAELQTKPLETWTMKQGNDTFQARLVAVENQQVALFSSESGEITRVRLSLLASEDAYRVAKQAVAAKRQARDEILVQLQVGLKLLQSQDFASFVEALVPAGFFSPDSLGGIQPDDAKKQFIQGLEVSRADIIAQFDSAIQMLENVRAINDVQLDDSGTSVRMRIRDANGRRSELQLQRVDGAWKLQQ